MTPTQPTEEQKYAALQRFIAEWKPGMPWQYRYWRLPEWKEGISSPGFYFEETEYRIPPAPKIEPWDFAELAAANRLAIGVRRKSDGDLFTAIIFPNGARCYPHNAGYEQTEASFEQLATDFEQLDHSPCGKGATA